MSVAKFVSKRLLGQPHCKRIIFAKNYGDQSVLIKIKSEVDFIEKKILFSLKYTNNQYKGGYMRTITILLLTLCMANATFAQSATLALKVAQKSQATVEDAMILYLQVTKGITQIKTEELISQGLLPRGVKSETPLTKGILAYMIAKQEHITQSLMFNIFKSKRYAVFACIAAGYMPQGSGELDPVSGVELLEVLGRVGGEE
ncbi:MAG: hypothetical protein QHH74_15700 [Spirochaetota bacterium]|nr:hypothetical protein [Spirochaetota bacterium]